MLTFRQFLNEEKWQYTHGGYIKPDGKVINGDHKTIADAHKSTRHDMVNKHGHARFMITTDHEAHYHFNHQKNPKMLDHVMKHAKEHEHHIKQLHLDSGHHAIDTIASDHRQDPMKSKKIDHIHKAIKHWLDN